MGIRLRHMWRFEYWTKSDKEPYIYNQYVSNEFFTREEARGLEEMPGRRQEVWKEMRVEKHLRGGRADGLLRFKRPFPQKDNKQGTVLLN